MDKITLLDFLYKMKYIQTYDYTVCDSVLTNYLDFIDANCDFLREIDSGIIYVKEFTRVQYFLIDGLDKILSMSLLLHAICECYKKTTERNTKAIDTIRKKYLINKNQTKLRLCNNLQVIYDKIIYGQRLSGKEKEHPMFILLHNMWSKIKEEELKASEIFDMLQKITINIIDINQLDPREIYYSLNKDKKDLNQILLIEDYLKSKQTESIWDEIKNTFNNKTADIIDFLKDFIKSKFNYKDFEDSHLYEYFKNYFETISLYKKPKEIVENLKISGILYSDLININIKNEKIKKLLIKIKMLGGQETNGFLLSIYEDYTDGSMSEATLIEILMTIEEYLKNKKNNPNKVRFDELIRYLSAFIACK